MYVSFNLNSKPDRLSLGSVLETKSQIDNNIIKVKSWARFSIRLKSPNKSQHKLPLQQIPFVPF